MYVIRELQDRPLKLNIEQSQREQYMFFSAPDTRYIGSTQSLSCQLVLTQYQYDGGCLVILHILNLDTWSLGSGQKNRNLGQKKITQLVILFTYFTRVKNQILIINIINFSFKIQDLLLKNALYEFFFLNYVIFMICEE